jgi:acid phosphatase class B
MNTDSMRDIVGNEVRVGDRVAFVTTGYSHRVKLRVGTVSKIRYSKLSRTNVASVRYEGEYWRGKTTLTSVMQLPRVVKIS